VSARASDEQRSRAVEKAIDAVKKIREGYINRARNSLSGTAHEKKLLSEMVGRRTEIEKGVPRSQGE
jgi:hypothetical protein